MAHKRDEAPDTVDMRALRHAERLGVAGEQAGWLLHWAANYLHERGQYRQAQPIAERALRVTEAAVAC